MDDVIVVGAGPSGNNTALALANNGYEVTVIDPKENIGDKLCTGLVGEECFRSYPIEPELVYREINVATVVAPSSVGIQFTTPRPVAKVVDRVAYVSSFAKRAMAAGARYRLGERVLKIRTDRDRIEVTTNQAVRHAKALVLAAGFGSQLNRQLGFGQVDDYVVGVQALVATQDLNEVKVYLGRDVAPGFFAWVVPTQPGQALAGLLVRKNAPERFAEFLKLRTQDGTIKEMGARPTCWGIPLRPLGQTYRDRLLVVGDAAGQVKPTTGGGIFYSLLASEVAADTLDDALQDNEFSAVHLARYQREWRALLARELEVGYSARRLFEYLGDGHISSLIDQASKIGFVSSLANSSDVSFDWHSSMIGKIIGHPGVGGLLRLVSPLLAKTAPSAESEVFAESVAGLTD